MIHASGGTALRGKSAPAPERESIQTLVAIKRSGLWQLVVSEHTRAPDWSEFSEHADVADVGLVVEMVSTEGSFFGRGTLSPVKSHRKRGSKGTRLLQSASSCCSALDRACHWGRTPDERERTSV